MASLIDESGTTVFTGTTKGIGGLPLTLPDAPAQPVVSAGSDGAAGVLFADFVAHDVNNVGATVEVSSDPAMVTLRATTAIMLFCALTPPPDSLLSQHGKVMIWLDETNGAAKLMFKTMQADETLVTGSVSLSP